MRKRLQLGFPVFVSAAVAAVFFYQCTVAAGLILGALADVFIMKNFIAGLVVFLLAHTVYIVTFLEDERRWNFKSAFPAFVYAILIYTGLSFFGEMGTMAFHVAAYALVISILLWRALARRHAAGVPDRSVQAGIIGALLFVLSDSILVVNLFVVKVPAAGRLIMLPNWAGQGGIFLSALWRHSEAS